MQQSGKVLIVEDDHGLREALSDTLDLAGYDCISIDSAESALSQIESCVPQIVISDINLAGMNGHELLAKLKKSKPELPVLLMTAYGNVNGAVQAMRNGAVDYLIKPFAPEELVGKIKSFINETIETLDDCVVQDKKTKQLFAMAKKVADSEATVLIAGPSGAGKEVVARYIHNNSIRAHNSFVAINCAAIPENMLEATLFGYEKGAFTGAYQASAGKFEQAQNGTLLLDEISEMDLGLQAKLLRVIQEREVERLGGKKIIDLNVRIIATTNRNLINYVNEGKFREDLYYRLNVFPLYCHGLKDRLEDILPLVKHLLRKHARAMGRDVPSLTPLASDVLQKYPWPGNVREMDNVIQRCLILQSGSTIDADDLHLKGAIISATNETSEVMTGEMKEKLGEGLKAHEYEIIFNALQENDGNRKSVAEKLGISERTLRYKLARMRDEGYFI